MKYYRIRLVLSVRDRQRSTWILIRAMDEQEAIITAHSRCKDSGKNFAVVPEDITEITQEEYQQAITKLLYNF